MLALAIYSRYTYHFTAVTALSVALLFACIYVGAVNRQRVSSGVTTVRSCLLPLIEFVILSAILYVLVGGAYFVFVALVVTHQLLLNRRAHALLYTPVAIALVHVEGVLVFGASAIDAFLDLTPWSWKITTYTERRRVLMLLRVLYLSAPAIMLIGGLLHTFVEKTLLEKFQARGEKRKASEAGGLLRRVLYGYGSRTILKSACRTVLLIGVAGGVAVISADREQKALFEVDYFACNGMWPQVLKAAERHPYDDYVINAVNRALYYTGRLGYEMCMWPQHPDTLMLTGEDHEEQYWKRFDTRLDLGLLNMAQKDLSECLEMFGPKPILLKRLALVCMAKNDIGSARVYLGALSKTLFDAEWARKYLTLLEADPNLATDQKIQHLRRIAFKEDRGTWFSAKDQLLGELLAENKTNHMAFEYLNAWYLQTKQLPRFLQNIRLLNEFSYREIPALYEEAILIHTSATKEPVDLGGRRGSQGSVERMQRFGQIVNRYGGNKQAAARALAGEFGGSYFFYYLYGFSGVKR